MNISATKRRPAGAAARVRGISGSGRVWILSVAMTALAGAIFVVALSGIQPAVGTPHVPWYVLAGLFFVTEILVVHFQFRREVHTFSLSEIPFVLGLFFATPAEFVIANVIGAGAALVFHRRQSFVKLAFNVSQFTLGAVLGIAVFHAIRGESTTITDVAWIAVLAATLVMNLVGISMIASAIALSEGRVEFGKLAQVFRLGLAIGITNTVVVLTAVTFLWHDPGALWLLAIPVLALYAAYRAYISEREKHESLEFLYESTSILQRTPDLDRAILELLQHTRRMFKAEAAELSLLAPGEQGLALRTTLGQDDEATVMEPIDPALLGDVWARSVEQGEAFLITKSTVVAATAGIIATAIRRDAVVAPLRGDHTILGMLLVANRLGDVSTFDQDDLRLLATLASHAGVALENGRLGESLTQLTELKEQLSFQAFHDALTGLPNRSLFLEAVGTALSRSVTRSSADLSVLYVDLDDFKTVNDSLGHAAGDELLKAVSERLRSCLRPSDVPARLGGDEFAILLEDASLEDALRVGDRIIAALHIPVLIAGTEVLAPASVGIAAHRSPSDTADGLLRNADVAMYTAKSEGKGRVAVFEPAMHAAVVARHALTGQLQRALKRHEFLVRYQPIVSLDTGRITGVEALLRWQRPDGTVIGPADFVPLAEETGLILPIGRWVLETACRQAALWDLSAPQNRIRVSVNLSARQVQQPRFIEQVADVLESTGLEADQLVLEITETVMMQDTEATIAKLNALKALGVQIAIDDFGTGYSSLSYLRRFPVDVLKMAKPFVDTAGPDRQDAAFAEAIIALGHSLKLKIVAEGIERREQLELLRKLGCDLGQGYYFAEALDAEVFTNLLNTAGRQIATVPIVPPVPWLPVVLPAPGPPIVKARWTH
jgi:diguanylate cyclase (GGDEF)-like protein